MAFTHINQVQCTDCDEIMPAGIQCDHDCPNDPMKDPVKRAEHEAWQREFDRQAAN